MLVCDECRKSSNEVPLAVKGIVYTGLPKDYIVVSTLCQKCDEGEDKGKTAGKWAKEKIKASDLFDRVP